MKRITPRHKAFTLIELLTVVAIISLLISIMMPSLGRARDQAKGVHCLARLKDMGTALAAYENINDDALPPAEWIPQEDEDYRYGWAELLFNYVYREDINLAVDFPAQQNNTLDGPSEKFDNYFICKASAFRGRSSGHYRVYLPNWSAPPYPLDERRRIRDTSVEDPRVSSTRSRLNPKKVLLGDANELSERGDGLGEDDNSYIGAGEADAAGSNGQNGNRFSDRHFGGTNYLFGDLHAAWSPNLIKRLALDWNQDGVDDVELATGQ